ncbi:MAG: transglycosylase SLT domain-containing protein [Bacteroidales bacterium]
MRKYTLYILLVLLVFGFSVRLHAQSLEDGDPVLNEIFISKYLRFFDKSGKERDADDFFSEFNAPLGEVPTYHNLDSLYKTRLDSITNVVKLPYNSKVKAYIDVYVNKKRKQVNIMLALSQYYFPIFEEAMSTHGVPPELKYLAIIESALNPRAESSMGAGGLWQFMYRTGRMYDLAITHDVDERYDPIKASNAAALYLKDLYNSFGDWTLAIAAYNCGPGNVNKAIKRANGKTDFWEIYPFLPKETRGYVPAYIGATYVMNYYKEHGFFPPDNNFPLLTDTLVAPYDIHLSQVAHTLDIPLQILRDLNPQYKNDLIPSNKEGFSIKLPIRLVTEFIENQDSIYFAGLIRDSNQMETAGSSTVHSISYRIKAKETLSLIGRKFNVSVNDLMKWNHLKGSLIHPNQILTIHTKASNVDQILKTKPSTPKTTQTVSTSTENLALNTKENKPLNTTETAKEAPIATSTVNKPKSQTSNSSNAPQASNGKIILYKVKKGDTLYGIVRKNSGSNINEVIKLNDLRQNGNIIYPDQVLKIQIN